MLVANGFAQPYLDFLCADCDSLDRIERILVNRKLLARFTHCEVGAGCPPGSIDVRQRAKPIDRASGLEEFEPDPLSAHMIYAPRKLSPSSFELF
jgi:hypothetical protein